MQRGLHARHVCTGSAGAVESLTRGLALDLAPIRVNTVIPGVVSPCSALRLQGRAPATMISINAMIHSCQLSASFCVLC